ncbi:hypothetical protein MA16_Dca003446 [Dendrobium catenatum]|uniref:Uncharacterized protein n=1 Tax=Dendrobium catenatum TaxID=906689 RepID=A0A2I0XCS1_9ASPA|nr:hypothetical protein MA16_Dca003446 [Dendrobium catenatum]
MIKKPFSQDNVCLFVWLARLYLGDDDWRDCSRQAKVVGEIIIGGQRRLQ